MANLNIEGPVHRRNGETGPKGDQLGGVIETEDEGGGSSRQALPSASLAGDDVEINDINAYIRQANDAISRAVDFVSEANAAFVEANSLIESWSDGHSESWPIDEIEAIDEPCEIDEIEAD